nr:hypothetical protein [Brevibacillus laterosporus]
MLKRTITMSNNQVLEVKIENLHRELYKLKEETKEDIKEINSSIKGNEKLFNKAIVTMTENITRLTTIAVREFDVEIVISFFINYVLGFIFTNRTSTKISTFAIFFKSKSSTDKLSY